VVNQEDAGHLAYIANRLAETAAFDQSTLETANPDLRTQDLAKASSRQTKSPGKLATWVVYERCLLQSVVLGELGTLRVFAHVHESDADSLPFDGFLNR